jgi:hypothetical protein
VISSSKCTVFSAVSFERTPPSEISSKLTALQALGWMWLENRPARWISRIRKEFPDAASADRAEDEIHSVMGAYYIPLQDLAAPGSSHPFRQSGGTN